MAHLDADEQNGSAVGEWSNKTGQSENLTQHVATPIGVSTGSNARET